MHDDAHKRISMICQPNSLSVFLLPGRKSFLHPFLKVTHKVGTSLVLEVLQYCSSFLHTHPFAKSAKQFLAKTWY